MAENGEPGSGESAPRMLSGGAAGPLHCPFLGEDVGRISQGGSV